jgi:hypothetical protein
MTLMPDSPPKPPERRWFRFSLRSLLLLVVVVAIPLGWNVNRVQHQRAVVEELRKLNAQIRFDYQSPPLFPEFRKPTSEPPMWVRKLFGDDFFAEIEDILIPQGNERVNDDTLAQIATLTHLKQLSFNSNAVSDRGIAHLARLSELKSLNFVSSQVSDVGIAHLEGLQHLGWISIGGARINDDCFATVAKLKQLEYLMIQAPNVTDSGLMHLHSMPNLKVFDLDEAQVTDDGLERLRKALPNCGINGSRYVQEDD